MCINSQQVCELAFSEKSDKSIKCPKNETWMQGALFSITWLSGLPFRVTALYTCTKCSYIKRHGRCQYVTGGFLFSMFKVFSNAFGYESCMGDILYFIKYCIYLFVIDLVTRKYSFFIWCSLACRKIICWSYLVIKYVS